MIKESIGYFNIEAWCVSKLAVGLWMWEFNIYVYIYIYKYIHFPKMNMEPKNGLLEESE